MIQQKPEDPLKLCIRPQCAELGKTRHTRGLCESCYSTATKIVQGKIPKFKATWKELEEAGKCLPPRSKEPESLSWFMAKPRGRKAKRAEGK